MLRRVGDADLGADVELAVSVLGTPALRIAGREVPFPAGNPGRLLASLLLARGRAVTVDRLIDDVWGDEPPADARSALHTTVGRVRRSLGVAGERVQRLASAYRLDVTSTVIDADLFADRLDAARRADPSTALEAYDAALALWRGPPWAPWAQDLARGEALRLEEAHLAAREERARLLAQHGRVAEAVGELRVLVAEHPLRDAPVLLLIDALHQAGASADALAVFAAHREALADELGLDPSSELLEAQQRVLHREPQRRRESPRRTAPAPPVPAPAALVGRDFDVDRVCLLTSLHRCVTVVGPGGVGKTALARAVAAAEGAAFWVDLASVTTDAGVRAVTATALDVEVYPGGTPDAALHRRFQTAEGLLVLDNCEHVLGPVADLVTEIVGSGGGLRVLATSRERLGLSVEQVYPLPPLRLPVADSIDTDVPSVALFLARARAAAPDLEVGPETLTEVNSLVRVLDGLPLAIELAASRVGVVSLATLRERLDQRLDLLRAHHRRGPARHQTLEATIEWSYDLLDEPEKRAFCRLSTFAGPFGLDAADAVLGPGSTEQVLSLVERSLLVRPGAAMDGDYRMLETLRAYARSHLTDAEALEAGAAHARWAADLALTAQQALAGADEATWQRLVEARLPEFALAIRWSLESGDPDVAARIVTALYEWAYYRVRPDVLSWARLLVESGDDRAVTPDVLAAVATYWWMSADQERARRDADRGIELAGGPEHPAAYLPLMAAADTALAVGDLDKAYATTEHALRHALDQERWTHVVLCVSGLLLARAYAQEPADKEIALLRRYEGRAVNPSVRAMARYGEAEALSSAEPERALLLFAEAGALATTVDNRLVVGISLTAETALRGRVGALDRETLEQTVRAVEFWLGSGNENLFVTCLRNVVPLLDRLDAHRAVVELVAATTAHTDDRPPYGVEAEHLAAAMARASAALGPEETDTAWKAGLARSLDEAGRRVVAVLNNRQP